MPFLPDYLRPGLAVVFVGYNPGDGSFALGQHFAGRGNRFWKLLRDAGLTPRLYTPAECAALPEIGIGLTNIVSRPSPSSADLMWDELCAGAPGLRRKMRLYRPRVVCLLGKDVYRAYAGKKRSAGVAWGVQTDPTVPGTIDFVAPNPSGRSTLPYAQRLQVYERLAETIGLLRPR
ncbi:MAG: mismatch-specific DNA-glycosylase [Chloroflexota bacterium]